MEEKKDSSQIFLEFNVCCEKFILEHEKEIKEISFICWEMWENGLLSHTELIGWLARESGYKGFL